MRYASVPLTLSAADVMRLLSIARKALERAVRHGAGQSEAAAPDEHGTHGVIIERAEFRSFLLPQVAVQHRMTVPEFLAAACRKAGLPATAYLEHDTTLRVLTSVVFAEPSVADIGPAQSHVHG